MRFHSLADRARPPGHCLAWLLVLLCVSSSTQAGSHREDFTPVDDFLVSLVADHDLPGCSLRVVVDQDVVYERAVGYSLLEIVPTASAAKWLTAAVVMAAVDRDLLGLDDTTGEWLGWTGEKGAITLRQLLSHTSGIDGAASPCLSDPAATLGDCVDEIGALPLIGPPGGQFLYGGNSFQVAGRMCEIAAGDRPFVDLFAEFVGDPLAMTSTAYTSTTNPRLAGGARTSLRDYSHLVEMWIGGGEIGGVRVLTEAAVAVALTDQTAGAPPLSTPPCLPQFHGYGIGSWFWDGGAWPALEHSSPGAFRLTPWIDPARDLAGTFVTVTTADICAEIEELKQLVRDIVDGPVTAIPDEVTGVAAPSIGPVRQEPGGASVIEFSVPRAGQVRIGVVDLAGRRVATLADRHVDAGPHSLRWDWRDAAGGPVSSGVYLVTIEAGGVRLAAKAVVRHR